jgi:hypothetical protein
VTSKILGIGNAERSWGDVKYLKSGQRSHLSSVQINKQATIYGVACTEKAKRKAAPDEVFAMWDDTDMDHLGLDKFALATSLQVKDEALEEPVQKKKQFQCYVENWEMPLITKNNPESQAKLLTKYGGMLFVDDGVFTINSERMEFYKGRNCLVAMRENYDPDDSDTYEVMEINKDLFGLFYTYIRQENPNLLNVKLHAHPDNIDAKSEWRSWLPDSPDKKSKKTRQSPRKSPRKKNPKKGKK